MLKKSRKIINKLNKEQMIETANYIGQMHNLTEVQLFIADKFNIHVSIEWLRKIFLRKNCKWKKYIETAKNNYLGNIETVPGTHKKVRLARYDMLYEKAVAAGKVSWAKNILDSMREEIEGKEKQITVGGNAIIAQINKISDEELLKEKDRILEKLERLKRVVPLKQIGGKNAT